MITAGDNFVLAPHVDVLGILIALNGYPEEPLNWSDAIRNAYSQPWRNRWGKSDDCL